MKKWYPSNSSDGMAFTGKFCMNCFHEKAEFTGNDNDKKCPILMKSFFEEPDEWVYGENGATCTEHYPYDWAESIKRQNEKKEVVEDIIDPNQLKLEL